jgi:ATP-binding cassette subfamily F protein uup
METLDLLEELLQSYPGTVLLVSHDRRFIDNVVTSTIAWEGEDAPGRWREYEGGYEDWQLQRERSRQLAAARPRATVASAAAPVAKPTPTAATRKLSFKEQRELQEMPARIEALEAEQRAIGERLASASLYTDEPQRVADLQARYALIDDELLQALERWEVLSAR